MSARQYFLGNSLQRKTFVLVTLTFQKHWHQKPWHHLKICTQSHTHFEKPWSSSEWMIIWWQWQEKSGTNELFGVKRKIKHQRWEFWLFPELSVWHQHERAPPVFDSAAVTYHRAQQFGNKSKLLSWGYGVVGLCIQESLQRAILRSSRVERSPQSLLW